MPPSPNERQTSGQEILAGMNLIHVLLLPNDFRKVQDPVVVYSGIVTAGPRGQGCEISAMSGGGPWFADLLALLDDLLQIALESLDDLFG